ncbi:MAG: hypothetical protein P1U63_11365 [Coxiellaceae bacterium]|nr:hypothetical protein [Coxiellaceae bacterium]
MLKSLLVYQPDADSVEAQMIEVGSQVMFHCDVSYAHIEVFSINEAIHKLSKDCRNDFFVLALILVLSENVRLKDRIAELLKYKRFFNVHSTVWVVLQAILDDDITTLQKPSVLGEAYHNKRARVNGMRWVGLHEYKKQMLVMKEGDEDCVLKAKYDFLNKLPKNTLGGALCELLRQQKISLPGEPNGFAEFFLWHDLSHVLSGNGVNYAGELGANIFTAAYSQYGKLKILLFGLLQFNLGYKLAVVAVPSKNEFIDRSVIRQYFESLYSGVHSKQDFLQWPLEQMVQDLHEPLAVVRKKYNLITYRMK